MNRLLVTVDSLRHDHFQYLPETLSFLESTHDRAFATSTATLGSFPSIISGEYPEGATFPADRSVVNHLRGRRVGITTNHLLSNRYGYDTGFDSFTSPGSQGVSVKQWGGKQLTQGSVPYKVASAGWGLFQQAVSYFRPTPKSFRPAEDVIDQFTEEVQDANRWFGWLHFMEPHHPYDPDGASISRVEAQQTTRRVLGGNSSKADRELARELYRREVEELDDSLAELWDAVPEDTRVVFCADHGELLGEEGLWGHPGEMHPHLLRVPFGTRNAPELGDVVSLIDVPSVLRSEPHGEGKFDRDIAFAYYGDRKAAINATNIASTDETIAIETCEKVTDQELERQLSRFEAGNVVKEDAVIEDLEDLGYV